MDMLNLARDILRAALQLGERAKTLSETHR